MRITLFSLYAICLSGCTIVASTDDLTKGSKTESDTGVLGDQDGSDGERGRDSGSDARPDRRIPSNDGNFRYDASDAVTNVEADAATDAETDAGPVVQENEPCDTPEEIVCAASASASRLICDRDQEIWVEAEACDVGEACDTQEQGVCKPVVPPCLGRQPGDVVCDGVDRHTCGPDLVTSEVQQCASNAHCQQASGSDCAVCVEDEYACEDAVLLKCNDDRDGWTEVTTCDSIDLCNAGAKQCTDAVCVPDQRTCDGDALQRCNDEQSGFEFDRDCEPGLCDAVAGECDICSNNTCSEDRSTRRECSDDGQTITDDPCPSENPICVGDGNCVQCETENDCQAPECQFALCSSYECVLNPESTSTSCSIGHCDGDGECVECTEPSDCPSPPTCFERICDSNECDTTPSEPRDSCGSDRLCDGDGHCVGCLGASDCPSPPTCFERICDSNECDTTPSEPRSSCESDGLCDGDGHCYECLTDTDCPTPPICRVRVCTGSNDCTTAPSERGTPCGGSSVCNGDGGCVECVVDDNCLGSNEICRDEVCVEAIHTVGWDSQLPDTYELLGGQLYYFLLPKVLYDAQLLSFGVWGAESGAALRMALYRDDGNRNQPVAGPIAETANPINLIDGPTEQNVSTAVSLSADESYWVAFIANTDTDIYTQAIAGARAYRVPSFGYGNPFPSVSDLPGISMNGLVFNIYIRVRDTE